MAEFGYFRSVCVCVCVCVCADQDQATRFVGYSLILIYIVHNLPLSQGEAALGFICQMC